MGFMTHDQILRVLKTYRAAIRDFTCHPVLAPTARHCLHATSNSTLFIQLLWMCDEIERFMVNGHREKAMRWLGFIQGAMWALDIRSIEDM